MRVLILGGTGLTGPFTVRRLAGMGHEITVFHRGEHRADLPSGVEEILGAPFPPGNRDYDVVIHMWAMSEADARSFVRRFRGRAGRAVVISSGDVYRAYGRLTGKESAPPDRVPLDEDAPLRESRYPYNTDYEKIQVEQVCREQSELPLTILRFPAVYGPNDSHRFRPWLKAMLDGARELPIPDTFAAWRWTHGYAEDVAGAVALAATDPRAAGRTIAWER